jgi:8-oxo-dGTP pyrophosphatase MutT (NUDIX family)
MRGRLWVAAVRPQGRPEGHWTLPKGLVDAGEEARATAVREVREETGLEAEIVEHRALDHLRYTYARGGQRIFKIVSFWLMRPVGGRLGAIPPGMEVEVADVRWLPLEEAPSRLAYGGEAKLVAQVRDRLAGPAAGAGEA